MSVLLSINFAFHRGQVIGEGYLQYQWERQRQGSLAFMIPVRAWVLGSMSGIEGLIRAIMQTCCESQYNQQTFGIASQVEIQIVPRANDPKDAL